MEVGELEVLSGSPFCSLQDRGRSGYMRYGFPASGPLDSISMRAANYLLCNQPWDTCMEIMVKGPKLKFYEPTFIAITGANVDFFINGLPGTHSSAIAISKGDVVTFGAIREGQVAYLGIQGGFKTAQMLGSQSTLVHLKFGTIIQKGLKLAYGRFLNKNFDRTVPNFMKIQYPDELTLRIIKGPESDEGLLEALCRQGFRVSPQSNRMGVRLQADAPLNTDLPEMISSGVLPGTIQLTSSGDPIIMLTDHQTAGGYPRIGMVITHDLDFLAQMPPNSTIKFREINLDKAVDLLRKREQRVSLLFAS